MTTESKYESARTVTAVEGLFYFDGTPVSIEINNGKISDIFRKTSLDDSNLSNVYIAPGLIDNQINGYVSVDFMDEDLSVEGVRKATHALWKAGVTSYLPTITTNSHERLKNNFNILAQAVKNPDIGLSIPGFHLEGPYISSEDGYRGFHFKEYVRPPTWKEFIEYYEASENNILQVSLAPEIEGALDFISNLSQNGIIVGLAHHNASSEIIKQAVDKGAIISTHLGNGCANMINRHENPLWSQLADDRLIASIIVDGFHLRAEEVQVFYKIKGSDRIILTSDVVHLAGMPPGEYMRKDKTIVLTPDGMIKHPEENILAGAALPLYHGISNIMSFTDCSLVNAVDMTSRNPARLYGLQDRGEVKIGKRADLILFSVENGRLKIKKTILEGRLVYEAGEKN